MENETPTTLIDELCELLDAEREALLAGDVAAVERLAPNKTALIETLNDGDRLHRDALEPLTDKIKRNQALLSSALEGIRAAATRMAELHAVRQSLKTYDPSGRIRKFVADPVRTVEKRA